MQQQETTYIGTRTAKGCQVVKVTEEGTDPLDPRLDLWNHSPTGFEWGYGGSGPAQTALALLADATGNDRLASALHQDFKRHFVARAPDEGFELTAQEIEKWVSEHRHEVDLSDWDQERNCVSDPDYTPTLDEAMRHPREFVEGMEEEPPAKDHGQAE